MLSIKNKLYNETIIVTDLKIQDNTTPEFYLTIDSDSNSTIYDADHTLTIDTKNTSPTLEIAANLTIESTSLINQDLTTDASVTFGSVSLNTDLAVTHGGTGVGSSTGTVAVVLSNSPTLVTPVLGVATATSISISGKIIETVEAHSPVSSGTEDFDLDDGSYHTVTVGGDFTVTFSSWPSSGKVSSITIKLTNAGAHAITWPGVDWPGGVAPAWTAVGTDFALFFTDDGGTIIHGTRSIQDSK